VGQKRNVYRVLAQESEGTNPLGQSKCRWRDNIKTDVKVIGWENLDTTHLAQNRDKWRAVVNKVMNIGSNKILDISRPAKESLACQEGFCSTVLVSQPGSYLVIESVN
jgi:hypothetical protein